MKRLQVILCFAVLMMAKNSQAQHQFGVEFGEGYDLPLNTIRDKDENNWKISSIYASIAVKVGL